MPKLTLTTWERVSLYGAFRLVSDLSLGEIDLGLEVLDLLDFTEEERETLDMKALPTGAIVWDASKAHEWGIDFTADQAKMLDRLSQSAHAFPLDPRTKVLRDKIKNL